MQKERVSEKHKLAEDFGIGGLRIAEVHHLIKQLVDDDKVITNTLLAHFAKVLFENFNQLVQEQQSHRSIDITVSDSQDCPHTQTKKTSKKGTSK